MWGQRLHGGKSLFGRQRWNRNLQSPLCPRRPPSPPAIRGRGRRAEPSRPRPAPRRPSRGVGGPNLSGTRPQCDPGQELIQSQPGRHPPPPGEGLCFASQTAEGTRQRPNPGAAAERTPSHSAASSLVSFEVLLLPAHAVRPSRKEVGLTPPIWPIRER